MKRFSIAIAVAAVSSFSLAQNYGYGNSYGNGFEPLRWSNLIQGDNSAITRSETVVISSANDWEVYWKRMNGVPVANYFQAPRVCDFMFEDLVIIHAGLRNTGGYGVFVENVYRPNSSQWNVNWVLMTPDSTRNVTQVRTSPYTIIRVQRTVGVPYFQSRTIYYQTYQGGHWGGNHGCQPPVYMVGKGGALIPYDPKKNDKRDK